MAKQKKSVFEPPKITMLNCTTCGVPIRPLVSEVTRSIGHESECRLCYDMFLSHQAVYVWVLSVLRNHGVLNAKG